MNNLQKISLCGFRINWGTVLVGWEGPGEFGRLVSNREIIEYACDQIDKCQKSQYEFILEIASIDCKDDKEASDLIEKSLSEIVKVSECDLLFERRKWRIILLKDLFGRLPEDPLNAILEVGEFWHHNFKSPLMMGEKGNNFDPLENFRKTKDYAEMINRVKEWLDKEESLLKSTEALH